MHNWFNPQEMLYKFKNPHEYYTKQKDDLFGTQLDQNIQHQLLQSLTYFDDDQTHTFKEQLIDQLRNIIIRWLKLFRSNEKDQAGELAVFGSYRSGVNGKDGDIDLIILAPPYIDRDLHFFSQLPSILNANSKVSNLYLIQEALVPLIRFKYSGVQFDLVFACVKSISKTLGQSEPIDEKSNRTLNGLKVSEYFNKCNLTKVQIIFLKVIKAWAINRGIYGNVMGYLGGISWQILVCKILQLYPNLSLGALLERFFFVYSRWKWSEIPVLIEKCEDWRSSVFDQHQKSVMVIITPIYPNMNSSHNVSNCTLNVIEQQLKLGDAIIQRIKQKELQWSDLLKKIQFFELFSTYLQIRALSQNQDDLVQWKSHIESKLRKLNKIFDESDVMKVVEFQLYPKSFQTDYIQGDDKDISGQKYNFSESYFYGIKIKKPELIREKLDFENITRQFCDCLEGQKPYIMVPLNLSLEIKAIAKEDIPKRIKQEA